MYSSAALETNIEVMPWYAGKVEVANYLKDLNKDKKVCMSQADFEHKINETFLGH